MFGCIASPRSTDFEPFYLVLYPYLMHIIILMFFFLYMYSIHCHVTFFHQWRDSLGELPCSACSSSLVSSVAQETLDLKVKLHQIPAECIMRIS